jgi:hypothetical protein
MDRMRRPKWYVGATLVAVGGALLLSGCACTFMRDPEPQCLPGISCALSDLFVTVGLVELGIGAIAVALGWYLMRRYRDPRP